MDALLRPKSVAIVGASSDPRGLGGRPLEILRQHGYSGVIHVVNPRTESAGGLRTVPTIADVGSPVDLAAILVAPPLVPRIIDECGAAGVGAAYIFTSGFGEADAEQGRRLDAELQAACRRWPMRVAGPNGEGVYNAADGFVLTFSPVVDLDRGMTSRPVAGNVAVVAQSGGIGFGVMSEGMARGIRFRHVISTGNEVDVDLLDWFDHLLDDDETRVIVLFVEGLMDPRRLRASAWQAAARGKRVVVMKIGRTEAGQRAALSHTGHMSGRHDLYSSLFAHFGFVEVDDMEQLLDVTTMLAAEATPAGRGVGLFSASGGAGVWLLDALHTHGLVVPELPATDQSEIAALLPYYANSRNPIDYTAAGAQDPAAVARSLEILAAADGIDALVVVLSLMSTEGIASRLPMFLAVANAAGKPMIVATYTEPTAESISILSEAGVPWFRSQTGLAHALASAIARHTTTAARIAEGPPGPVPPGAPAWSTMTEHEVKSWLRREGLTIPDGELVQSAAEAVAVAERIGYPVVLKLQSAAASHKTELGAVAVGLGSAPEVETAWTKVTACVDQEVPTDQVDGVLVEAMAGAGVEMMIGVVTDPELGPFVLVGSGGVAAEVLHDVAILPAPITPAEAKAAIGRLRLAPMLGGWRGAPPADVNALADAVSRVSHLAVGERAIAELDLNPVVVHPHGEGVTVLDGLAVVGVAPGEAG